MVFLSVPNVHDPCLRKFDDDRKQMHMRLILQQGFRAVDDARRSCVTLRQVATREPPLLVTGLAAQRKRYMKIGKGKRTTYQQNATPIFAIR